MNEKHAWVRDSQLEITLPDLNEYRSSATFPLSNSNNNDLRQGGFGVEHLAPAECHDYGRFPTIAHRARAAWNKVRTVGGVRYEVVREAHVTPSNAGLPVRGLRVDYPGAGLPLPQ